MKALFPILIFIFCLAGCQTSNQPSASAATDPVAQSQLAGSYLRGDGLGYNIHLTLKSDGAYEAKWHGCVGEYGTARGMPPLPTSNSIPPEKPT